MCVCVCVCVCMFVISGLDPSNYRSGSAGQEDVDGTDDGLFGSHGEKRDPFEDVEPLLVTCQRCYKVVPVRGSRVHM